MPSTDPFADSPPNPSQPAPAPPRHSMFKKRNRPAAHKPGQVLEADAISFFSRSGEIFKESLEMEKREREREMARKRERGREERRRSEEGSGADEGEVGSARKKSKSKSESRSLTPPPRTSRSASKSIHPTSSPLSAQHSPQTQPPPIISLSDTDTDDETHLTPLSAFSPQNPPSTEPISIPSSPTEEELYPELIAAARLAAASETTSRLLSARSRSTRTTSNPSTSSNAAPSPARPAAQEPILTLLLTSPLAGTTPLLVRRKLSQRLKDVRLAWCDKQLLAGSPMTDAEKTGIFLTWKGRRVWDVTTCGSMGVRVDAGGRVRVGDDAGAGGFDADAGVDGEGNVHLEAWTEDAFREMQERRRQRRSIAPSNSAPSSPSAPHAAQATPPPPAPAEPQKLKLILTARSLEPVKLIVKATTTIGTLINGFRSSRQIGGERGVELWFDGERLEEESCVGDADLEDMSGVDVILR